MEEIYDKLNALETAHEIIKDSLRWAYDCSANEYAQFVSGVVEVTEATLHKIMDRHTGV